MDTRCNWFKKK